jgi:ferrous iron transport protein A
MFRIGFHRKNKGRERDGLTALTRMRDGQSGKIVHLPAGMLERLMGMGIRPGQTVRKISAQFLRGPVTVQVEKTQVAIGFGAAVKILVRTDTPESS